MTSLTHRGFVHLGMDVSRDSIAVAILEPDSDVAVVDKIPSDEISVRRLVKRIGRPPGISDRRDARRLAGLHRSGELTAIGVPSREQEAVRDLCRTRGDMVQDLTRARNRLTKFLLRHGIVYRAGSNWTFRHERWLSGLSFDDPATRRSLRAERLICYRLERQSRVAELEKSTVPNPHWPKTRSAFESCFIGGRLFRIGSKPPRPLSPGHEPPYANTRLE